jgi:hypothetical protein
MTMKQIRVRLSSAVDGAAAQVSLSDEERAALKIRATALGYSGVSTYVRAVGEVCALRGRERAEHFTVFDLLKEGADEAHMSLGAWLRVVALEAAGLSMLGAQLKAVG